VRRQRRKREKGIAPSVLQHIKYKSKEGIVRQDCAEPLHTDSYQSVHGSFIEMQIPPPFLFSFDPHLSLPVRGSRGSFGGAKGVPTTCTAQHSTEQNSTAQHSTAQHSTAQHGTARERFLVGAVTLPRHYPLQQKQRCPSPTHPLPRHNFQSRHINDS